MKPKIVSYTFDTLPPVSEADEARLRARAARPDSETDTSDAREMTAEEWKNPLRLSDVLGKRKRQVRATLDADVLAWLKSQGRGYHSRLNAILRREMLKSLQSSEKDSQQEHTAA